MKINFNNYVILANECWQWRGCTRGNYGLVTNPIIRGITWKI
jgi:hypothetical protein